MSGRLDTFSEMTAGIRCLPDFLKPTDSGFISVNSACSTSKFSLVNAPCYLTRLNKPTFPFSYKSLEWGLYCCTTSTPPYAALLNSPLKSLPAALDH